MNPMSQRFTTTLGKQLVLLVCIFWACCQSSWASQPIELVSYELNPYIGQQLPHQGATAEIVKAAFAAASTTDIELDFYTAKRAQSSVQRGLKDALFPVVFNADMAKRYILSAPLPGIQPGLLRIKENGLALQQGAQGQTIGVVRGGLSSQLQAKYPQARIVVKEDNYTLLTMLMLDRLDFVFIDKFTAADLMVDQLPELIGKLEFVESSIIPVNFHVAFSRQNPEAERLVAQFNKGLNQLQSSGQVNQTLERHGLYTFPKRSDKKVIRIATVANDDMLTMQKLSSQFESQHPDIELEWHVLEENTLRRRLLSDLAIGAGQYDVMTIGSLETSTWAPQGWLTPFDDLPERYQKDDLLVPIQELLSYQGSLMALPFYGETSLTYYRKDLFAAANLTMKAQPSYDDILNYAQQLHDPENEVYGVCLRGKAGWGENMALLSTMVNAYGGQWVDMDWRPAINSVAWKQAATRYLELLQNYGPPSAPSNGYLESLQLFADGHCGIWVDATVAAGYLFNPTRSSVVGKVALAPAPKAVTDKGNAWLWAWSLAIPSSSKLKQPAHDFITWATSADYIKLVGETYGWVAAPPGTRYSTYTNTEYQRVAPFAPTILQRIVASSDNDNTLPPSPYKGVQYININEFPSLGTHVGYLMNQALQGKQTLAITLTRSQLFAEQRMRAAGYLKE